MHLTLIWIILGLFILVGCGDSKPPKQVIPTIVEESIGPRIEPAPLPSNVRARVQQHPGRAEAACRNACEKAGGKLYKVGPADTPHGWECLCSWES